VWLRLFAVYGPGDNSRHLIPYTIQALFSGISPRLSAGTQFWDYLHAMDAAEAVAATAFSTAEGVFNLASGSPWRVRRLAEFIRDYIDPALPLDFANDGASRSLQADVSKLSEVTGWKPRTPLERGLSETIEWYRPGLRWPREKVEWDAFDVASKPS
jgi:nucleoside-diphosphate-sugar epimerase